MQTQVLHHIPLPHFLFDPFTYCFAPFPYFYTHIEHAQQWMLKVIRRREGFTLAVQLQSKQV